MVIETVLLRCEFAEEVVLRQRNAELVYAAVLQEPILAAKYLANMEYKGQLSRKLWCGLFDLCFWDDEETPEDSKGKPSPPSPCGCNAALSSASASS